MGESTQRKVGNNRGLECEVRQGDLPPAMKNLVTTVTTNMPKVPCGSCLLFLLHMENYFFSISELEPDWKITGWEHHLHIHLVGSGCNKEVVHLEVNKKGHGFNNC